MLLTSIKSIVVLTGAGVSAESGIKTFRDSGGLWEKYRAEEVASPQGFAADPALVHRFYNMRRNRLLQPILNQFRGHIWFAPILQALFVLTSEALQPYIRPLDCRVPALRAPMDSAPW